METHPAETLLKHPALDNFPEWTREPWLREGLGPEELDQLTGVLQLLHICNLPTEHTHQVTRLSLCLFDDLQALHGLGKRERFLLECAALLHDIGWIEGEKNHHKNSLQIILTTPLLLFDQKERLVIGSIARYHRKALPSEEHDHFHALDSDGKSLVSTLASMLRMADGLDASHRSLVKDLSCTITKKKITVHCLAKGPMLDEKTGGEQRSDLMGQVFKRNVSIQTLKKKK